MIGIAFVGPYIVCCNVYSAVDARRSLRIVIAAAIDIGTNINADNAAINITIKSSADTSIRIDA